ncbi:hypothetical protein AMECASPLE_008192 [Ameca splendens]|uniref:Uncharacterized protein n=1 Tax=Ameca splendens TaxID=208324 RepID=A0ABV0Z968_9TELE
MHTLTPKSNLEIPINLTCMLLDCERRRTRGGPRILGLSCKPYADPRSGFQPQSFLLQAKCFATLQPSLSCYLSHNMTDSFFGTVCLLIHQLTASSERQHCRQYQKRPNVTLKTMHLGLSQVTRV